MVEIAIIEGEQRDSLLSVDASEVIGLLRRHGAVRFRGFGSTPEDFAALTHRYSIRHTCDPSKVTDGRLQTMPGRFGDLGRLVARVATKSAGVVGLRRPDDGTRVAPIDGYGLNPHNENTFIPGAEPDLVWFLCVRAATDGGSTLLCDGPTLWNRLSDQAKDFAASTLLRYELTLQQSQWKAVYDVVEVDQLLRLLDAIEGTCFHLSRSNALHYVYETDQVGATLFDGDATLSSNVLSRRPFGEVGVEMERLASGEPMPSWFVQELLAGVAEHHVVVDLEPTEVIMIDNSRVMHGRTPFTGHGRRVLTRCSWLDPALVMPMADGGPKGAN